MLPLIAPSHSARRLPAASRGNLAGTFGGSLEEGGMSPVAIVTASDSGIGQECAKELAENGFDVGITYRSDEAGAKETLAAGQAGGGGGKGEGWQRGLAGNGVGGGIPYRSDEAGAKETLAAVEAAGRRGEVRRLDLTGLPPAADAIDGPARPLVARGR